MSLLALLLACNGPAESPSPNSSPTASPTGSPTAVPTVTPTPTPTTPPPSPPTNPSGLDEDGDGWGEADGDCDDSDPSIHPGAEERCDSNGTDEDCNGVADDADPGVVSSSLNPFFADADGDGFGAETPVMACAAPPGTVTMAGDCADADPDVHPGADEVCDALNVDENCDGLADDEDPAVLPAGFSAFYLDADGDGFGAPNTEVLTCDAGAGRVPEPTDCDDENAAVHPAAAEVCDFLGRDEDCDGAVDDLDSSVDPATMTVWYQDLDLDGYGDDSTAVMACDAVGVVAAGDCDDTDADVHPAGVESCSDPRDLNCDGDSEYADQDLDGWAACEDCNDSDPTIRPDADEVCDPGNRDENCDGRSDDADPNVLPSSQSTFFVDLDLDGFGGPQPVLACDLAPGRAVESTDCDEQDPLVHPGAVEVCDPLDTDEDCDGLADDLDDSVDPATLAAGYLDADGDGFGDASMARLVCDFDTQTVATSDDCDDSDATVNPGAVEVCDADDRDEDCSGAADDDDPGVDASTHTTFYQDADRDGFGTGAAGAACDPPVFTAPVAGDCDDTAARTYPGAPEMCDGERNDCDANWSQDVGVASYVSNGGLSWTDYTDRMTSQPGAGNLVVLFEDGTLRICPGVWYSKLVVLAEDVTILGTGSSEVFLDGGQTHRSIQASGPTEFDTRIEGVTIRNGAGASLGTTTGGGISFSAPVAHLEMVDVVIDNNSSVLGYGGAVVFVDTLVLEDVQVSNNDGTLLYGGGILRALTSLDFDGLVVRGNITEGQTGGVHIEAPIIHGNDLVVEDNFAEYRAGGVGVHGDAVLSNVVVKNNDSGRGGGLDLNRGEIQISGLDATNNVSSGNGGAINIENASVTLTSGIFASNAAVAGAAVYVGTGGEAQLTDCMLGGEDVATASNGYSPPGIISLTCDEVSCQ